MKYWLSSLLGLFTSPVFAQIGEWQQPAIPLGIPFDPNLPPISPEHMLHLPTGETLLLGEEAIAHRQHRPAGLLLPAQRILA